MDNTTTIALSRLTAQSRTMGVLADNIANMNTPGYKAERMLFADWLSPQQDTSLPSGQRTLDFTQDLATYREQQAGPLTHTGNPLDIAIGSAGFFTVGTARGPRLTRAGHFSLNAQRQIVDMQGEALLDTQGKPLTLGPQDSHISIAGDGTLSSDSGQIGRIGIVAPGDANRMQAEGGELYAAGSPTNSVAAPKLVQGAVEGSNVQPVLEVTRMMTLEREFQFVTQFVQAEADRQQNAIDKIAQPMQS
jgi:flagellar basal-body rod protein FlgF